VKLQWYEVKSWPDNWYERTTMPDEVEAEFKCPHGIVFAQRRKSGAYVGTPKIDLCPKCRKEYLEEKNGD
jgi:hypothetical protein